MNSYEAYKLYFAIKHHFTQDSYDFFKYHGSSNVSIDSYERRKDHHIFQKLSKHNDPLSYLVSQFIHGNKVNWTGELFYEQAADNYTEYLKRTQSLMYNFTNELDSISTNFISYFKVPKNSHPKLLKLLRTNKISPETIVILNNTLDFFSVWDYKIKEQLIWPDTRKVLLKYTPFVKYDKKKTNKLIKTVLDDNINV